MKLSNLKWNFLLKELPSLHQNTQLQLKEVHLTNKEYVWNVSFPKKKITKIVKRTYLNDLQVEDQMIRNEMLAYQEKTQPGRIPSAMITFNTTFFNTADIIYKHWYLLHLNESHTDVFMEHLIIAFRRNKKSHWSK